MEDNCPPTPLHIRGGRNSKSPNQMTVSSPDSDGRKSPDSRCVICLGKLQKKSFTDSCLHQFCFQCLLQWSKVKAECPLCKQPFKSIIHNVRSNCDYDQYNVERREPAYVVSEILHSYDFDLLPVDRRFRYRSTMTREFFGELAESFLARTRTAYPMPNFVSPPTYHIPSSGRFSPVPERRTVRGGSDFRRSIYEQDLWVQDLVDITGRYRECTPQFYRENPAQIHRIIPWLNREINSLLNDYESYTSYVLDRIVALLTQHTIRSREFREAVEPYFGCRTDHFIHELYMFARSVYDITGFDQNAVYGLNPNYGTEVQEISSSSDDSDIEIIGTLHEKNPSRSTRTRRNCRYKKSSRLTGDGTLNSFEPIPGPSGINNRRTADTIDVCESDNDDIKIIEYIKPKPELVIVSSGEEDTKSAFAEDDRTRRNMNDSSNESDEFCEKQNKNIKRGKRHKSVSGKGKSNGSGSKEKQKRKNVKNRKKRDSSISSISSISSVNNCNSENDLNTGFCDSDSSMTTEEESSSYDSEPLSKYRKRKLAKKHYKKFKKSDRKNSVKTKDGNSCTLSRDYRKKAKVKSCIVVPSSSEKNNTNETSIEKNEDFVYSDEQNSDSSRSYLLPSYWSLLLGKKLEKRKKRKRSKERKTSPSGHRGNKQGEESDGEKPQLRKRRMSSSPGRSNVNDSSTVSIVKNNASAKNAKMNSILGKNENSTEISEESSFTIDNGDEKGCRRQRDPIWNVNLVTNAFKTCSE